MNIASDPPGPKHLDGDFNAPGMFWSTLSAPAYLLSFLESIRHGGWNQRVTNPTRTRNVLDFILWISLTQVQKSSEANLPGCDHLPVSYSFTLLILNRRPNLRIYFKAGWNRLPTASRNSNWDAFFFCQRKCNRQ